MNAPLPADPRITPRAFHGHLIGSATGAANDNLFRQVVAVALVALAHQQVADQAAAGARGNLYVILAGLAFILPFVLLAPLAGALGDRIAKHRIVRLARLIEIPLCLCGVLGMALGSPWLLLAALCGLAAQSAFFAPVKLAVVPDLVADPALPSANGQLQAVTTLAILGGTALAFCADQRIVAASPFAPIGPAGTVALVSLTLCAIGLWGAWRIPALAAPPVPPGGHPPLRPFAYRGLLAGLRGTPGLWAPAISLAGFWSLGAAAQLMIISTAESGFRLGQAGTAVLILVMSAGMVAGSLSAPFFMSRAFPAGLPLAGALLAAGAMIAAGQAAATRIVDGGALVVIGESAPPWLGFAIMLFVVGLGAGLWEIPLQVLLQQRAPPEQRNRVMAAAGILAAIGMVLAMGLCMVLTQAFGLDAPQVLMVLGGVVLALALGFLWRYRKQFAAWLVTLVLRGCYEVRVTGAEHLPATGGCLVVCNHLSYADGAILAANLPRPGRFLVYRRFVDLPVIGFVLKAAGVIPVAAEDSRRALIASIDAATEAAKAGEVVVIFPEGKLTRGGGIDTFRQGMERIASRAGVPVIPAHLGGLWGSFTSRAPRTGWPRPLRRVELRIGSPLPPTVTAAEARNTVMQLGYDEARERSLRDRRTLGAATLARARAHPFRIAVHDAGGTMTYLQLAVVARALVPLLGLADDERRVGVLLPPGRGGTIVNLALVLAGRTPVNLNHTAGPAQVARMCEIAGVRSVVSAAPYLRRIGDPGLAAQRMLLVDELLPKLGKARLGGLALRTLLLPARWQDSARPDDTAAIVFSSGSTGDPKGIELTHRQILANCDAVAFALDVRGGQDVLLSPLPLFHSFGLVPGMWLGLMLGMTVAAQPDPTDGKALGELAEASRATFLISAPTFVRGYLRRVEPAQFKSLRFAVVGAERCPADLKAAFKERYGADLLEGYGCTELAPVVAVNLPTVLRDGVQEVRNRDGSVGRPLPGIQVLAMDPETGAELPVGAEGLLVARSASRMKGYLGRDDLTAAAFVLGGYNTGDMGRVDADGFVHITGRLARFAKIGGEMVPLDNVETLLQQLAGERCEIAVAAVPDPGRGEKLVVLHTGWTAPIDELFKALDGQPALWRPKARDAYLVDAIPRLGTGKRDLAAVKRMAAEKAGAAAG